MSKASFYIAYDGPALAGSEMDIRDLAPALVALSDLFDEANAVLNKGKPEIHLSVRASFRTGCFGIELNVVQSVSNLWGTFVDGMDIARAADIIGLLGFACPAGKGLVQLVKRIANRKVDKIEAKNGNYTLFVDEGRIEVEKRVFELYKSHKVRTCLEGVVRRPLMKEGINAFLCADKKGREIGTTVTKEEADFFSCPPAQSRELGSEDYVTTLQIVSPNFQEGNKWRFSDGSASFYARITDQKFLKAIDDRQCLFGKGDLVRVKIRDTKRVDANQTMASEKEIVQVLKLTQPTEQMPLPGVSEQRSEE